MKVKTSELTGAALDWLVAHCEINVVAVHNTGTIYLIDRPWKDRSRIKWIAPYTPSTSWAQGGPIIEREKIRLDCPWNPGPWEGACKIDGTTGWVRGDTPLIAAMRCYVMAKLGDEVNVPEELLP